MSKYEARINTVSLYAQVVRIDYDGEESVDACFKSRHFSTMKAAVKATQKYINSFNQPPL